MHPDTTTQLATIHQDDLRRAATHHRVATRARRLRPGSTPGASQKREA
jgi:hypothetical protein